MGVFHIFKIVQMVPNRATHHIFVGLISSSYLSSFKRLSFKVRCSLFILSGITCDECSEFLVIDSLTKVDVERSFTKIDRRLAASSIPFLHYICCAIKMGKYLVKKQVSQLVSPVWRFQGNILIN